MPCSKIDRGILQQRTAAFVDSLLPEGAMRSAAKWRYHDLSRERNGHKDHWMVPAIADIHTLPMDVVDALLARLTDERNARACTEEIDVLEAQLDEEESDGEENVAGCIAMQDPSKRPWHRDRLVRHRVKVDRLILAYDRDEAARQAQRADPRRTPRRAHTATRAERESA